MANQDMNQPYIGLQEPRIPFIRFEQRTQEKRQADGTLTFVDVDYALVTAQGAKDTTEKIVAEWFPQIKSAAREGMYPTSWISKFEEMYRLWKETKEDPVDGTPVKNWPAISPAECKILLNAGVRSIEDLAHANEEFIGRIGMGARRLKQMAIDWVTTNETQGPVIAQLDTMRQSLEAMTQQIAELRAENARLAQQATQQQQAFIPPPGGFRLPSVESRLEMVRGNGSDEGNILDEVIGETLG